MKSYEEMVNELAVRIYAAEQYGSFSEEAAKQSECGYKNFASAIAIAYGKFYVDVLNEGMKVAQGF